MRVVALAITLSLGSVTLGVWRAKLKSSANHTGECAVRVSRQGPQFPRGLNRSRGRRGEGWDCLKIVGFLNPLRDRSFRCARQGHRSIALRMIEDMTASFRGEGPDGLRPVASGTSRRDLSRGCFPVRY